MKAYSEDLRKRIVDAVEQGYPRTEPIKMLGVSLATIKRYLKQYREMGHIKAKRIPGRSPKKLAALQAGIVEQLRSYPDVSLERHCELWEQAHGVRVSRWMMSEAIKRVEWTRKKSLWQKVERNEEERANWRRQMSQQEADRLVFLDECGSNIALTPLYARAPKGERARGSVPRNRGKNMTLIASLSLEGIGASMILEGGVDALAFATYIEQILAPSLQPGQIVVMDNLSVHKVTRVQQLIEERGCQLLFLPAYSPDFSPIEETKSCA